MIKQLLKGIVTYIPGAYSTFVRKKTGGTDSAKYCYSVWLRHLVMANRNKLSLTPTTVAEIGPGDSIGIGLAALLSGVEKYSAFDVVEYVQPKKNLEIFDELIDLFKRREDIPGEDEFPKVKPKLKSYEFPSDILTDDQLSYALGDARIERTRKAIYDSQNKENSIIRYVAPWCSSDILEKESVNMIYSQAVLEHVEDLANTYEALYS